MSTEIEEKGKFPMPKRISNHSLVMLIGKALYLGKEFILVNYSFVIFLLTVLRREKNVVTAVKNQHSCGACWAFSTVQTVESMHAIATGDLNELSTQQVFYFN
jgi:hypothetical protein